jgi:hypothetical protein
LNMYLLTYGSPRLNPIPPNAETSSNNTRNRSNHFFESSRRFPLSMMAMKNTAHTSHQISVIQRPVSNSIYFSHIGHFKPHLSIADGAGAIRDIARHAPSSILSCRGLLVLHPRHLVEPRRRPKNALHS